MGTLGQQVVQRRLVRPDQVNHGRSPDLPSDVPATENVDTTAYLAKIHVSVAARVHSPASSMMLMRARLPASIVVANVSYATRNRNTRACRSCSNRVSLKSA